MLMRAMALLLSGEMRHLVPFLALVLALSAGDSHAGGAGTGLALPETRTCGETKPMPFPRPKGFAEWNWNALAARLNGRTGRGIGLVVAKDVAQV